MVAFSRRGCRRVAGDRCAGYIDLAQAAATSRRSSSRRSSAEYQRRYLLRCSGQLNVISTQMASRCVCIFFEWKQCRHFVWFSAFCKSFHSCSYVQLLVNHYSYQAAATSRRSFEQNVMLFSATGQRVFTCKNRRRYSRERASQSLEENSIHFSFAI